MHGCITSNRLLWSKEVHDTPKCAQQLLRSYVTEGEPSITAPANLGIGWNRSRGDGCTCTSSFPEKRLSAVEDEPSHIEGLTYDLHVPYLLIYNICYIHDNILIIYAILCYIIYCTDLYVWVIDHICYNQKLINYAISYTDHT